MGFFSSLVTTLAPIAAGFLGVPAPPTVQAAVAQAAAPTVLPTLGQAVALGAAAIQPVLAPLTAVGDRGTGALRRRTIVETFNPTTGGVFKREILKGAPAVMQSDVAAANRLNRQLRRLNKKQPKKLVRQSTITQLKDEVVETALRHARDGGAHHGHNGEPIIIKT